MKDGMQVIGKGININLYREKMMVKMMVKMTVAHVAGWVNIETISIILQRLPRTDVLS